MEVRRDSTRLGLASNCSDLNTNDEALEYDFPDVSITESSKSGDSFSEFGEGSCGEPQMAQHLVVDFTHSETDSEFVQKKCCAFWELVESHPEIHHLMVMPDSQMYPSTQSSTVDSVDTKEVFPETLEEEPEIKEHTAVSMLDFVTREGMIDKSFEAKIPQTFCPLGSREYMENEATQQPKPHKKKEKDPALCHCPRERVCCSRAKAADVIPASSEKVRAMCKTMKKWDLQHPKSMEPPARAVPLIHSVMQRRLD
ncbi:uncharacterized protein LOC128673780 [Plodia interpunctella]|uniref:uncharacterized protein LOC128673780 n=1 Tax=Plodia interpunctella TaxID=58824 RepID=UPI002367DD61|nr:uncharacterized protein LOC128673780 [Plodia interpunctella]